MTKPGFTHSNLIFRLTTSLQKGLNFAVSCDRIPHEDFIIATEKACSYIPVEDRPSLRAEVTGILRNAKPPKSNISKDERAAIKSLKKKDSILIMGADKGRSTVVLDKDNYEEKVHKMLQDEKTYEVLKTDPTPKYKRKLISILSRLKKENKIDEKQYKLLYPTTANTPRLYCTTKIHKKDNPIRPIVDYTDSMGYETSRALADLLNPFIGNTEHHVKNSKDLADELSGVFIEDNEMFNSHDVVSLFTNTPIKQSLDIIEKRLMDDKDLKKRTKLSVQDIVELLEFILTTTYFEFCGGIYRQRFGAAMGSPVSPIVANFFMEFLEQHAIATAPVDCRPGLWKRYVDDILEIIKKGQVQNLTDHLNQADSTNSIKFTHEEEKNGKIPFLDTLIIRKSNGAIKLLVYRKPTHTDQYLNFSSEHPLHQKMGVIRTLFDRMNSVVTEEDDRLIEEERVRAALRTCGYPEWAMNKVKE